MATIDVQNNNPLTIVTIIAVALLAGVVGWNLGSVRNAPEPPAQAAPAKMVEAPVAVAALPAHPAAAMRDAATKPPPPKPPKPVFHPDLAKLFVVGMIGAQVPFFEAMSGPPVYVTPAAGASPEVRVYKAGACQVTVTEHSIQSMDLPLGPDCTANVNSFFTGTALPTANAITFGDFARDVGPGNMSSDCLMGCGVKVTPAVYEHYTGPRTQNFLEVSLKVDLVTDDAIDAAGQWMQRINAARGEATATAGYDCTGKYDLSAAAMFATIRITEIAVGYGLSGPWTACSNLK